MPSIRDTLSRSVKAVIVFTLAGSAALLLAFGPRASDRYPRDAVVVDYWEKWTGIEEAGMRQIVDDFNSTVGRDKHIYVRYLSTSAIEQKTLVATAGAMPPDVAGLYNQDIPQFASMNALEPLDEISAAHGITAAYYKKVFWDECRYDGKLYGLVSTAYDLGLYYNKEVFAERADSLRAMVLIRAVLRARLPNSTRMQKRWTLLGLTGTLILPGIFRWNRGGISTIRASGSAEAGGTIRCTNLRSRTRRLFGRINGFKVIPSGWAMGR